MASVETILREEGAAVWRGGNFDRWDLEVRGGLFGAVRMRMAIEEHGAGRQLIRIRSWPRFSSLALFAMFLFAVLATFAATDQAWAASAILGFVAALLALRAFRDCGAAAASYLHVPNSLDAG
jgi:hypothetical protein